MKKIHGKAQTENQKGQLGTNSHQNKHRRLFYFSTRQRINFEKNRKKGKKKT